MDRPTVHRGPSLDAARVVVYAVHGRDQNPEFMAGLARRIDLADVAYVLPAAAGSSWYPLPFMSPIETNQPSLGHALDTVTAHLDGMAASSVDPARIVLLGFSQGACLLAEHLLTRPRRHGGAVLHTGGYFGPVAREQDLAVDALAGLPVLMDCSSQDAWVPLSRVHETGEALTASGAQVDLRVYDDAEHHVDDESISRIRELLNQFPPHPRDSQIADVSSTQGEAP